jgi:hypothetical protein
LPPLFPLVLHLFAQMREAGAGFNHVVQAGGERSDGRARLCPVF